MFLNEYQETAVWQVYIVLNMIKYCIFDRVDVFSINYIDRMNENEPKIQLPDMARYVIVNIDDKIKCDDLAAINWRTMEELTDIAKWISSDIKPMVVSGFNEELIRCYNTGPYGSMRNADFFVLNPKFGNNPGVIESLGLFQKQMNSLHQEFIQFVKYNRYVTKANKIIYYPSPNSVGGESHRRLLMGYAKTWTNTSETIKKRLIVQAPYFEREEIKEFSVIPNVWGTECMETYKPEVRKLNWHFPSVLSEISKYFNSVLLRHGK